MGYADHNMHPVLACANKVIHDAAVFLEVTSGRFSLVPTTESHFVELMKKNRFNEYFQDLYPGDGAMHLAWEATFAQVRERCNATSRYTMCFKLVASLIMFSLAILARRRGSFRLAWMSVFWAF